MYSIGLAEDDHKIATLIKNGLEENGYQVRIYQDGKSALEAFQSEIFQLLIIDVMMPQLTGIAICKALRENHTLTPILMLTALGTVDDKVSGLEAGADDYLVKPFHFKELLARIEALLRRQNFHQKTAINQLQFNDLTLNLESKEVKRNGHSIDLTAKEFALLELFMLNPNRLLSRRYIAEKVWDVSFDTGTNVIEVYINLLRKKVDKDFPHKLIHNVYGMGYVLKSE